MRKRHPGLTGLCVLAVLLVTYQQASADPPTSNYIFPAGGQQGTVVAARFGGCNLDQAPRLIWTGSGITVPPELKPVETVWFEGPVIPQPASQQKEDYPRDYAGTLAITAEAPPGRQTWRLSTSQGVTTGWGFIVGTYPEVIEHEVAGNAPAVRVELPVTINGRVFPREDVDAWSFQAKAGETVTCRVATSEFGSPLDARIEVRAPNGMVLGEQLPEGEITPDLRLIVPADGEYQVRIHDMSFGGLQDHVYRLTLTRGPVVDGVYPLGGRRGTVAALELHGVNLPQSVINVTLPETGMEYVGHPAEIATALGEIRLELDDHAEILEVEPIDATAQQCQVPSVLNGRIQSAGDVDTWTFTARKGIEYDFDVRAACLGSALDAVLEITDAMGKRLVEADDSPGIQTDARIRWTAPADGEFRIVIRDRLASRGGPRFAYRVRVIGSEQSEFTLSAKTDTLILERDKTANLKLSLDRGPGFKDAVELVLEGLPPGVTVSAPALPLVIAANQREIQLTLKADATARVAVAPMTITGRAKVGDREQVVRAEFHPATPEPGRVAVQDSTHQCWIAIAVPTPFKFLGAFETKYIARGSVFVRKYHIDRNGYDGPLEVQLADRQGRHLQGVTALPVVVPSGESDFEFAVRLPPWMEIGRTCRSTLTVTGQVTDADGTQHTVSYSSNDQNNQMIALVDAGRFAIQLPRTTLQASPGQRVQLPVRVQRGPGLDQKISVELIAPDPIRGVTARSIEIADGASESALSVEFADTLSGVDGCSLIIRATTRDERGLPVTAETRLIVVEPR